MYTARCFLRALKPAATSGQAARLPSRLSPGTRVNNTFYLRASSTSAMAKVTAFDHIVLTVADVDASIDFYTKHLGMKAVTYETPSSGLGHALTFGNQKINLHKLGAELEPKAQKVTPGSGDVCFVTEDNVDQVLSHLKAAGVDILEGGKVVDRTGARGKIRSVYFRDPDGNLVEVSNYV